jgi:hypothetical protein
VEESSDRFPSSHVVPVVDPGDPGHSAVVPRVFISHGRKGSRSSRFGQRGRVYDLKTDSAGNRKQSIYVREERAGVGRLGRNERLAKLISRGDFKWLTIHDQKQAVIDDVERIRNHSAGPQVDPSLWIRL